MKKLSLFLLPLLLILALSVAACGKTPSGPGGGDEFTGSTVTMAQTDFEKHSITVTAGTTITFKDNPDGTTHILCIGENGKCDSGAQGPQELTKSSGTTVEPGKSFDSKFDQPGTYKIACIVHPNMNMVVTVK